jgi:hypothetical protein
VGWVICEFMGSFCSRVRTPQGNQIFRQAFSGGSTQAAKR